MGCGSSSDDTTGGGGGQGGEGYNSEEEYELGQGRSDAYKKSENKAEDDGSLFKAAEDESAEQFMAVKPWIGALVAPSDAPQVNFDAPDKNLELEYCNGYRCEDSRQNIFWTSESDQIVYMTAAIGVVLNIGDNTQSFFGVGKVKEAVGHNDDIEALHVNSDRTLCATGQRGKNPSIFVWNIATKEVIAKFQQGRDTRAVRSMRFTKDDKYLISVDLHDNHNVHVFDIAGQTKVGQEKTGNDDVWDMDTGSGQYAAVIGLKRTCKFVEFDGRFVKIARGLAGTCGMEDQCSVAFLEDGNSCLSGTTKGNIFLWMGNRATKKWSCHSGSIHAICVKDGKLLSSGYKDKTLKIWDQKTMQEEQSYQLPHYARSIDYQNGNVICGTRDGQIFKVQDGQLTLVMNGHGTGETWGLAYDKGTGYVLTTGDDNKILYFDPIKNKVVSQGTVNPKAGKKQRILGASSLSYMPPNQHSRAVDMNSSNGHVALGTNYGEVYVRAGGMNLDENVHYNKISKEWIEVVKYSPCGKYLGVGSHDNKIYILSVEGGYNVIATCAKHNSFITSFDWSEDSSYIQSVCGAYEYLFYDANSGSQMTSGASALRDELWATFSCKLGWPVKGIFPPYTDGSHVNGVDRSNAKDIFATGDDWGLVNLYRNPNDKGSNANSFRAHSSHVVRVKFTADDAYLYSVGGYDRTLMKWKVV